MIRLGCAIVVYKFQLIGKLNLLIGVKKIVFCSVHLIFLKSKGFFFLKKFVLILTLMVIVMVTNNNDSYDDSHDNV